MHDEAQNSALPTVIELLWGNRPPSRRGPRPGLSLERIVGAAIELADAHGLAAVSMNRVAERVGVTPMALYRYVRSKDDLLLLMSDAVSGNAPEPADPAKGWRIGLETWSRRYLAVLTAHPWMLEIAVEGPPLGPNQLDWMDSLLRALSPTTLPEETKVGILMLLNNFVCGEAKTAAGLSQASADPEEQARFSYGQLLRRFVTPQRYPALHAAVTAGVFTDNGTATGYTDADFSFGLGCVLDGVEQLIRDHDGEPSP
ncbi:TetR family transcriptional regulator [Nocardiopsis ansamitocini]|uniref:TetR family transcriptional regulator n=2 Tax=Nocardiopsis ansamitocini TaxID=1670832 RepID=A0A9W6UG03_9ACTN|nr:TetR family transcriptional regulator [Nocardiopsis ansamitocini]